MWPRSILTFVERLEAEAERARRELGDSLTKREGEGSASRVEVGQNDRRHSAHRNEQQTRKALWAGAVGIVLMALGTTLWIRRSTNTHRWRRYRICGRHRRRKMRPGPWNDSWSCRYGPLTDPANRQRAFLDFFNIGHIKGLASHCQPHERRETEGQHHAMAQWVENYRGTMTPEEEAGLGRLRPLRFGPRHAAAATAQYLSQDVHFRASTAPVIQELMTTLATVQKP